MSAKDERFTFQLPNGAKAQRLDASVVSLMRDVGRQVSRSVVQQWIEAERVLVDGVPAKASTKARAGVTIEVQPAPPPPCFAESDPSVHVDVLHQDDHLMVVNKPANLVVHPGRGHLTGTLVNGLLALDCFQPSVVDEADPDATFRPGIVHRLDKDTSGVLVVARTGRAREGLKDLFARHDIEREYQAVVVGAAVGMTHDTPFGRHATNRLKFTSKDAGADKRAVTHVRVLERLAGGRATLVQCRLETGRTHQIRVHLHERGGTPVLGDALYGPKASDPDLRMIAQELGRHWLHAGLLGFVHPVSGEKLRFEAPLANELAASLEQLRAMGSRAPHW